MDPLVSRLKKRQRGFHFEEEPGWHDLKGKFEEANRKGSGKSMKVATLQTQAVHDALAKFGFLRAKDGRDDPMGVLSGILRNAPFGFDLPSRDAADRAQSRKNQSSKASPWGAPAPIDAGDAASRMSGFNTGMDYSGV
jgi:hypothetical protein